MLVWTVRAGSRAGVSARVPLIGADARGEPVAEVVVGEQGRAAVRVVDDRDFEAIGHQGFRISRRVT
jgi:hypothetical protein